MPLLQISIWYLNDVESHFLGMLIWNCLNLLIKINKLCIFLNKIILRSVEGIFHHRPSYREIDFWFLINQPKSEYIYLFSIYLEYGKYNRIYVYFTRIGSWFFCVFAYRCHVSTEVIHSSIFYCHGYGGYFLCIIIIEWSSKLLNTYHTLIDMSVFDLSEVISMMMFIVKFIVIYSAFK